MAAGAIVNVERGPIPARPSDYDARIRILESACGIPTESQLSGGALVLEPVPDDITFGDVRFVPARARGIV